MSIQILESLRDNLVNFLEELISILPHEKELILFRFFVKEQVPMVDVAEYIVKNLIPLEDKVVSRDEQYFLTHAVLFESLESHDSTVNRFKNLWEHTDDPENKEAVWSWLHYFIKLGKKYVQLRG